MRVSLASFLRMNDSCAVVRMRSSFMSSFQGATCAGDFTQRFSRLKLNTFKPLEGKSGGM
jgi:hypothetical protein